MFCASHCLPSALIWHSLIWRSHFLSATELLYPAGLDVYREHAQRKWSLLRVTLDAFPINRWQAWCSKTWTSVVGKSGPAVSDKWLLSYKIINHRNYGLSRDFHVTWTQLWACLELFRCHTVIKIYCHMALVHCASIHIQNRVYTECHRLPVNGTQSPGEKLVIC